MSLLSVVFVTTSGGTVTVPTGAQGVIAFAHHWSPSNSSLSTISLEGSDAFTIANNIAKGDTGTYNSGQAVAYAAIVATGTKTFSFSFTATPEEGPTIGLAFFNEIDNADWIRATAADSDAAGDAPNISVASAITDVVIAYHGRYNAVPGASTGWTSQGTNGVTNQQGARVSISASPGASTTSFNAAGAGLGDYDSAGLVSVKTAAPMLRRKTRSGTFTPADGSLLVAVSMFMRSGASPWDVAAATAPTSGGLTWTRCLIYEVNEDYNNAFVVWTAPVVVGASMSVSIPLPANSVRDWTRVYEYSGHATSPIGLTVTGGTLASDGSFNPSLGASPASSSEVLAMISTTIAGGGNVFFTAGTGWTELDAINSGSFHGSQVQARTGSTDSTTLWNDILAPTSTDTGYNGYRWAAIEIKALNLGGTPAVTSTSSATPANGSSLTITGTSFGATQGAGGVTIGGIAQTVTSWSDTSIVVTVGRGTNKYGVAVNILVTNNSATESSAYALTSILPQSGWAYVNIGTPDTVSSNRLTASPDLVIGDQVAHSQGSLVTVYTDGTFSAASSVTAFDYEVWSSTGGGWGTSAEQTISSVVVYRPGTDVAVSGWTGIPGGTPLATRMAETTRDDASYVESPILSGTEQAGDFAFDSPVPAGSWLMTFSSCFTGVTGQVRLLMLDGSSTVLATGSWQALTTGFTEYTAAFTIASASPRFRIEVKL